MRVTDNMLTGRVFFNMQRALTRFLEMQTQMSSGRRINKPSDDPLGIIHDLDLRSELAKNAQYQKNIHQAQNWVQVYDTVLADLKDMVTTAKEIAIAMASGSYDNVAREASASQVKSIFDQMMHLSHSDLEGMFVFSGFRTDQKALSAASNGVRFDGDAGQIKFPIGASSDLTVNLNGADVFLKQLSIIGEDSDLNVGIAGITLLADLHNGQGVDQAPGTISITDQNLGITVNIDLSGATDIDSVITTINNALTTNVPPIGNLTIGIGNEGNNLSFDTTENGLISDVTPLDNLNGGNGVDLSIGKILLTDGAGTDLQIDLSGSTTIGDVITKFNAAIAADPVINNVTLQRNAGDTGLEIVDSNGVPLGLRVEEVSQDSTTARPLGILGAIDPVLTGNDLNPVVSFKVEEVGGSTASDLGILAEFSYDYVGSDLDPRLLATSAVSDLNGGVGFDMGRIVLWQGHLTRTIDLGPSAIDPATGTVQDILDAFNDSGLDITASINADGRGIQIVNNDQTKSLTVEDEAGGRTTSDLGIYGSSDMMGSILVLINALNANDQESTGLLLQNLDDAILHLLNHRAAIGARGIRLEDTVSRLLDLELTFTQRLSEVEDADITKLITDLATYENNYRASLIASAKIIQPSLLDFLK